MFAQNSDAARKNSAPHERFTGCGEREIGKVKWEVNCAVHHHNTTPAERPALESSMMRTHRLVCLCILSDEQGERCNPKALRPCSQRRANPIVRGLANPIAGPE